jgi:hypothetical protein
VTYPAPEYDTSLCPPGLVQRWQVSLDVYERALGAKRGRDRTPAGRTLTKLRNKGLYLALVDWAWKPPTDGFDLLVAEGQAALTAEYIVVLYADIFPAPVVERARARLQEVGVAVPSRSGEPS